MIGVITTITTRGFGFIRPTDGSSDVFFHASALSDMTIEDLDIRDRVTFEVDMDESGRRRARDVRYAMGADVA